MNPSESLRCQGRITDSTSVHLYESIQLNNNSGKAKALPDKSIFLHIPPQLEANSVSEKQRILKYTGLWQKAI